MSMSAPDARAWATCWRCDGDLYPHVVRRTDLGWRHVACRPETVAFMRCDTCHKAVEPTAGGVCGDCELGLWHGAWVRHGLTLRWEEAS